MCNEFFFRSRNYHNDKAASKELGFGDTVIGGRMTLSCVTELLTRHFGRGFYLGGRLDVKFTNVLWPNERFTTRGIITGRRVENGQTAPTSPSSARRRTEPRSSSRTRVRWRCDRLR
jgi:acyl dehydratase